MKKLKKWLAKSPLNPAIALCVFMQLADICSSILPTPGFIEQNPVARYPNGQFWIWHGIVGKAFFGAAFGLLSWAIFEASKSYNRRLAYMLAAIPLLYYAYIPMDAVISNVLAHWGWYIEIARPDAIPEGLRIILGQ